MQLELNNDTPHEAVDQLILRIQQLFQPPEYGSRELYCFFLILLWMLTWSM